MAYHRWLSLNRTWQGGTYWCNGLACGMDNAPRPDKRYSAMFSHGFMSWIDACAKMYLSGRILVQMSKELGREDETAWLVEESEMLKKTVNETMWDEETAYYYDRRRDGSLNGVKTVGSYWTLLAGLVPEERMDRFVAHLDNENEFKRPCRVPSTAYDHPEYQADGGYWRGAIWAPTNYMVLSGLHRNGYDALAYDIACNFLENVVKVFNETGTLYENYAPESAAPGNPAKPDFVGWTGLAPISILFEYVFGIQPDAANKKIVWTVNRTEAHGIRQYPLGDATLDLCCAARASADEEPVITVKSDKPVTVEIHWNGRVKIMNA